MASRKGILKQLMRSKNVAAERVIDRILGEATAEEQRELAEVLLQRNKRAGWGVLIRAFDKLDAGVKAEMLSRPRDLFGPLAETMQQVEGPARENVIAIVRQCADARLTYLLSEALIDPRGEVRELAGKSLMESVRAFAARDAEAGTTAEETTQVQRAVTYGLRQYKTHRQPPAISAALALERQQDGAMWASFQDPHEETTRAATLILRTPHDPAIARGLMLALGTTLKPAAMAGLAAADAGDFLAALIKESYRLVDPKLRDAAQQVGTARVFSLAGKMGLITAETGGNYVRLLAAVGIAGEHKARMLGEVAEQFGGAEGVGVRVMIVAAAAETGSVEAGVLLARMGDDADERVARIAARWLLGKRNGPGATEWKMAAAGLANSRHASVRKMATGVRVGTGGTGISNSQSATAAAAAAVVKAKPANFEKVWMNYEAMPPAVAHARTRAAAEDPGFSGELQKRLGAENVQELAQGLRMLASLGDITAYRGQVIALCGHGDARVAAIAVKLAGRLEDPRLKDLLDIAATHEDQRVRANAVESMEALHIADRSQQVLAMLNSRFNRERANAIKAISTFDFATARECLLKMLSDANPMHRISALWVVGQLRLLEVVRTVSLLARRDPNPRVRRRAAEMLDTMTAVATSG